MAIRRSLRHLCGAGLVAAGVFALTALAVHAGSATYTYDNAGRLRSAAYNDGSSASYVLDPAGNRTKVSLSGPDSTPPSVPTGLHGSSSVCSQATLGWNTATDNAGGSGVAGYKVYRGGSQIGTSVNAAYTDGGLIGGTTYLYSVAAYDLAGNTSAASASVGVTTAAAPPPSVPAGLVATAASNTQVNLAWSASTDDCGPGVGGYRIYRGTSSQQLSALATASGTTYSDTTAAANTTYWYAVSAYDTVNAISQQSSPVSVTTPLNTTDSLTLTPAALGQGFASYRGFVSGQYGQLSPTVLTGGMSVYGIYDSYAASVVGGALVQVSGFGSDPGQGWLWSVNAVGITKSGSGVRSYSYSGGTATWSWSDNFGFSPGSVATVVITHR